MNTLAEVTRFAVLAFIICSLGGVGLGVSPRAIVRPLRDGSFVTLALVASWVISPVAAVALLAVIPIDPAYARGLLMLALAPCAPFAPAVVRIAGGDPAYLAALMALSAATTTVLLPVGAAALLPGPPFDPLAIALPLVGLVLTPMLVGMAVRGAAPRLADLLQAPLERIAGSTGILSIVLIGVLHRHAVMGAIGSYALVTLVAFVAITGLVTHAAGGRLRRSTRLVLTTCACTRNFGAALAPLSALGGDPRAMVMIVLAIPATLVLSVAVALCLRRSGEGH